VPREAGAVETEYRLYVTRRSGMPPGKHIVVFRLETVRTFANFRYDLSVRTEVTPHAVAFSVLGLQPPLLSLPASGPASFEYECEGLEGSFTVTIQGLDGRINTCQLRLSPAVQILRKPAHAFIHIITEPDPNFGES
jgi:hypothetical protein